MLKHWAQGKIENSKGAQGLAADDEEICRSIVDELKEQKDVSCADIALTAWNRGKNGLATKVCFSSALRERY